MWSNVGDAEWSKVAEQHVSEHRWYDRYWLVLLHADGTFWGLRYDKGKTEMQETEWPWSKADGPIALTRLYPNVVTTTEYRIAPPALPDAGAPPPPPTGG